MANARAQKVAQVYRQQADKITARVTAIRRKCDEWEAKAAAMRDKADDVEIGVRRG